MQGYHFVLFYFQVFVNPVGLVESEGCYEKKKKKALTTCRPENSLVKLAGNCTFSLYPAHNEGNRRGLWKEY